MGDTIRVDIPELITVSDTFGGVASQFADIDTGSYTAGLDDALPGGSATAAAVAAAAVVARRAALLLADRAWAIADTVDRVCEDYENTDDYLAAELARAVGE